LPPSYIYIYIKVNKKQLLLLLLHTYLTALLGL
jgi:hypothetical protein